MPWELLSATNSLGLSELQAYELVDGPIGPQRADQRARAVAYAVNGGKWEDVASMLDFGTGAVEAAEEPEQHTLIELPAEELAARQEALRRKFEGIVGGPTDGNGR